MRLLLCEDEVDLSNALMVILKHNNYSVDAVYDGAEALEYLSLVNYDGIILDIMMPKVDGLTVLRTLRQAGNAIPILLLTAKAQLDDKVIGLDLGADDYLTKPFEAKELLARIRAMTRRQRVISEPVLSMGNISLNRATFELKTEIGVYRLANKEFQLMELLLMNQKTYLSSERLMEKIWGYDSEAEINVVWVHLSFLRKKLSNINANVEIKVARNIGYCLEEI